MLFRDFLYNPSDRGVMHAADFRKQMVFNLVVEATHVPGQQSVRGGEIGGGFHLVNQPFVFDSAVVVSGNEFGFVNYVSHLEHNAQDPSGDQVHDQVSGHDLPYRQVDH
jgi:hypothetical protein